MVKDITNIFYTFLKDKDILELISEGMRELKEGEGEELEEANGKSDESIEEKNGKELTDNLETRNSTEV